MSVEDAKARGRARAVAVTAGMLAAERAVPARVLQPEPYLMVPPLSTEPPSPWRSAVRWSGRGLRIEIGDRAYAALVIAVRRGHAPKR